MAKKRISCTKLSEVLKEVGINKTTEELRSTCEAYGRDVRCYLYTDTFEKRKEIERFLRKNRLDYCSDYAPGRPIVEIKVSYFKAWHWDE